MTELLLITHAVIIWITYPVIREGLEIFWEEITDD
nr:MAG TPA: hypothetical protein [Siphoviridae sp. ctELO16]